MCRAWRQYVPFDAEYKGSVQGWHDGKPWKPVHATTGGMITVCGVSMQNVPTLTRLRTRDGCNNDSPSVVTSRFAIRCVDTSRPREMTGVVRGVMHDDHMAPLASAKPTSGPSALAVLSRRQLASR